LPEKGTPVANNSNMIVGTSAAGSDGLGLVWFAPVGTTAPTDESGALNAAFKDAGGISEEGVSIAMSETSKKIKFYGSQLAQRTIVTDQETTFKMKFMEANATSLAVYWRKALGSITPAAGTGKFSLTHGTYAVQFYSMVVDVVDGTSRARFYCPKVEVSNRDDLTIGNGNEISWGAELTAYPVAGTAIAVYFAVPSLG
jgi:hypothetical protein